VAHSHDNPGSQALDMGRNPDAGVDKQLPVVGKMAGPEPGAETDRPVPEVGDKARRRAGRGAHPRNRQEAHP
jgi:hypothetical protein